MLAFISAMPHNVYMMNEKAKQMTDYKDMYLLAGSEVLSREFNDLGSFYSDFHKDVRGTRPHFEHLPLCASDYPDHASLVEAMSHLERLVKGLEDYMEAMKATFEGREQLRDEGWHIPETDHVAAAAASQALRDADRARIEYECSYEYHLDQMVLKAAAIVEKAEDDLQSFFYNKYEAV